MKQRLTERHLGSSFTQASYGLFGFAQGNIGSLTIFQCRWVWRMGGKGKAIKPEFGSSQHTLYFNTENNLSEKPSSAMSAQPR